jgi:hypothetical protein
MRLNHLITTAGMLYSFSDSVFQGFISRRWARGRIKIIAQNRKTIFNLAGFLGKGDVLKKFRSAPQGNSAPRLTVILYAPSSVESAVSARGFRWPRKLRSQPGERPAASSPARGALHRIMYIHNGHFVDAQHR